MLKYTIFTKLQPTDTVSKTSKLSDNKDIFCIMCICTITDVYILYRREGNFKRITEDAQISCSKKNIYNYFIYTVVLIICK